MKLRVVHLIRKLDKIERDLEELVWLLNHENGKTYAQAKGEVIKEIECVEYGCSLPNLASGDQTLVPLDELIPALGAGSEGST